MEVPVQQNTAATELFGSFVLGGDEFALPASCIREVVNFPDKVSVLPLSPPFLEGMFTLRGSVIPVVNLARIFQPEAPRAEKSHKIAILDFQQVLVGILFHATGEILRVRPDQRSTLSYAGGAQGVVEGAILLNDGARLIQVLNPAALISVENVPHVLALQAASRKQQHSFHTLATRRRGVSFRVGATSLAFEMSAIQEIISVPDIQQSMLTNKLCLGRIHFRGSQVGVIDFARLLAESGAGPADGAACSGGERRIVIVRLDDATMGFMVDAVDNIIHFFDDEVMPIPLLSKSRSGMFRGCISRPELGDVVLLDHRQILSHSEIVDIRKGHAHVYAEAAKAAAVPDSARRQGGRKVYITFLLDNAYAVEIGQVREIVDFPHAMTRPPGMPQCMRGMLNLRRQMISIIDLRSLYGMPDAQEPLQSKVLIVERGTDCYGLMVDSVLSIMTINDSKRFAAPRLMRNRDSASGLHGEIEEVIDINDSPDAVHKTLGVFECSRLLERLAREAPLGAAAA